MNRKITAVFLIVILLSINRVAASDSTATVYKNGTFVTQFQRKSKASNRAAILLADDFVNQFHTTPNRLFTWALKGLGLEGQKSNEMKINLKSAVFDSKTGITHGLVDVMVPNITTFNNVAVDARVTKNIIVNGGRKVQAEVLYSRFLLDKASGAFTIVPIAENEQLIISNLSIKFGWFFNIFITEQRYKSIVEWRVRKFTDNLKTEIEKREKLLENNE
jgi:hypothetical protein